MATNLLLGLNRRSLYRKLGTFLLDGGQGPLQGLDGGQGKNILSWSTEVRSRPLRDFWTSTREGVRDLSQSRGPLRDL